MSSRLQQVSNAPSSSELVSSGRNFANDSSSLAFDVSPSNTIGGEPDNLCSSVSRSFSRRHHSPIVPPTLTYPALATNPKTHSIIISIAKADPTERTLAGVEGDFPLILDELNARTTGTLQVITDLPVPRLSPQTKTFLPGLQAVGDAIRNAGQVMKAGSICYIYNVGRWYRAEVANPILKVMPLPSGERLDGKVCH
ncbi:hypothetical protein FRC01_009195 [Tulasnella sp. 417]|nr:hypothetical protein FRC01_009195 [Tulasnella sp. 417]